MPLAPKSHPQPFQSLWLQPREANTAGIVAAEAATQILLFRNHVLSHCGTAVGVWQVGGDPAAFKAAEPFLKAMGKHTLYCGRSGLGQTAKVGNT